MDLNWARSIGVVCGFAATAIASVCISAVAAAAVVPGTPVTPAPGVPSHGRAWELVSPPDPVGSATFFPNLTVTADGNRVGFRHVGLTEGYSNGPALVSTMISNRRANGWSVAQTFGPDPSVLTQPVSFGPEETGIWEAPMLSDDADLYRENRDGSFQKLAEHADYIAASPDVGRVIFSSGSHFLPADASRVAGRSIYELDGSNLRVLDVGGGGALISQCGSTGKAASTDVRRVYFLTQPNCEGGKRLYLAERGVGVREASASRCSVGCGALTSVSFLGATRDGSSAFFVTADKLIDSDVNAREDLYRYDAAADDLTSITGASGGPDLIPRDNPGKNGVQLDSDVGSVWSTPGGSRIYFFAAEVTGPEEAGGTGIYLMDANGYHLLAPTATTALVNVSADGRYALLDSTAPLAPGDSDGLMDVYRYDAVGGTFTRISQGPLGGDGAFAAAAETDFSANYSLAQEPSFRAMTDDASRVFFNTAEGLVPGDTNGLDDVYEWANGDLGLISSGVGRAPAMLLTSTPDGATVLFKTGDTLLPVDRDTDDLDYYAARIGGGFPEAPPASDPCPCREPGPARKQLGDAVRTNPTVGRIELAAIDAAERRRIARSGWIELVAEVAGSGKLAAEAKARLGRRLRTVASTAVQVAEPGPVRLRMRLSKAAREQLAKGKSLSLQLRVRLAGASRTSRLQLNGGR